MTEMFGEAWSPMSVPDLAPDDDDDDDCALIGLYQQQHTLFTEANKLGIEESRKSAEVVFHCFFFFFFAFSCQF